MIKKDDPRRPASAPSREITPAPRSTTPMLPRQDDVARRAYEIYQAEGCPEGRRLENWLQAERELTRAARSGMIHPRP